MEHQTVHHQGQQDHPENQPARKEQPRYFDISQRSARQRNNHVPNRRNEPCRCHRCGLKRPVPDPCRYHRQRQNALQRSRHQPQRLGHRRGDIQQRSRQQQKRNRNRREKRDAHRMMPFCLYFSGIAQCLNQIPTSPPSNRTRNTSSARNVASWVKTRSPYRAPARPNARNRTIADGRNTSNTAPIPAKPAAAAAVMNHPDNPNNAAPITSTTTLSAAPRQNATGCSRKIIRNIRQSALMIRLRSGSPCPCAPPERCHGSPRSMSPPAPPAPSTRPPQPAPFRHPDLPLVHPPKSHPARRELRGPRSTAAPRPPTARRLFPPNVCSAPWAMHQRHRQQPPVAMHPQGRPRAPWSNCAVNCRLENAGDWGIQPTRARHASALPASNNAPATCTVPETGFNQPRHHPQGRCFARSAGSDQCNAFPCFDVDLGKFQTMRQHTAA
ncbi:hypothetical protein GQR58_000456 [Nymphon striatum]|nr:hypothetical protein GQR58_000456 [Nymphon striatum]